MPTLDIQKIGLIGLGNWGTALGNHLANKGIEVLGWSNVPSDIDGINQNHRNPSYLSEVQLSEHFQASHDIQEVLHCKAILLVFPAAVLSVVVSQIMAVKNDVIIISAIKGFEDKTLCTPLAFIRQHLPNPLAVISGPSFAAEIVRGRPAGIVSASSEEAVAKGVAEIFSSPSLKVYTSTDPIGVELGGAVKNVIALAAGISDGLGLGESARAGLITRGLAEMMRLASALGADSRTLSGLSGLGDLAMTSTSALSRNRNAGVLLGQGMTIEEARDVIGSVVEGIHSTPIVLELAKRHRIEMPITEQMALLLGGQTKVTELAASLLHRPMKSEF